MKISVLTPAYNAAKYIDQLMESVERQDYRNYEHLIIDDGSSDDTAHRVRRYRNTEVISRENRGQFATLNELLELVSGDAFIIICADDYFAGPRVFSSAVDVLTSAGKPDVVVGRTPRWMERDKPYLTRPDPPLSLGVRTVRLCLAIQHCSMFVRTEFQRENAVYFDDSFQMCGDWDWMSRLWALRPKVRTIRQDFGVWRQHPQQKSALYGPTGKAEALRILQEQSSGIRSHRLLKSLCGVYSKAAHGVSMTVAHGPSTLVQRVLRTNKLR